ncbi:MAG TPA: hypothetical protein VG894_12555 [Bauldia sp.]|nr:hypothetical protein [Bauldia sp.]
MRLKAAVLAAAALTVLLAPLALEAQDAGSAPPGQSPPGLSDFPSSDGLTPVTPAPPAANTAPEAATPPPASEATEPAGPPAEAAPAAGAPIETAPNDGTPVLEAPPVPPAPPPVVQPPSMPDTPVEAAIRSWVAAVDASPDWSASVGGVTVDTSGKATVSDLTVAADKPGFKATVGQLVVSGFEQGAPGTFSAQEIDVANLRVDAGAYSVRIDQATVESPALPMTGSAVWDDAQPTGSIVALISSALSAHAASASAGKITVVETIAGIATWSTYANLKLTGLGDGKVSSLTAGPLRTDSPGSDPSVPATSANQQPLVSLTVATSETHDIDIAAMLVPFRSDGDSSWHQAMGRVVYSGVGVSVPGIDVKIGSVAFDNFIVRRPTIAPPPPAADPESQSPADVVRGVGAALSPLGVGRMEVSDLSMNGSGLEGVHLGDLTLVDASTDSIGAFSLGDFTGAVTGQGKVTIGRIAFGNLSLPPLATVADVVETALAGGDAKYSSVLPTLGYGEIAGVDVAIANAPEMKLDRLRVDLGNWADKIPTSLGVALAGLDLPAGIIPSDLVQRLLASYGYDRLQVDGGAKATWGADGTIAVRDASLAVKDAASISGQADIAAIPPTDAEHMAVASDALDKLSLKDGSGTLTDGSLVERALVLQASKLNVDPQKFRDQFAKSVPFMLMLLGDRDLIMKTAPVVQAFLSSGGSVTAVAAPKAPVPLSQVADTAKSSPWSLFSLLGVSLTGTPGTPGAALPTLPTPPSAAPAATTAPAEEPEP